MNSVIEVRDKAAAVEFIQLPFAIYKSDPNWIAPLKQDIEKVFDPAKNKFFEDGECIRWVLRNEQGITIGRIAAFINRRTAFTEDQPTGGCGFFECIDNNMCLISHRHFIDEGTYFIGKLYHKFYRIKHCQNFSCH